MSSGHRVSGSWACSSHVVAVRSTILRVYSQSVTGNDFWGHSASANGPSRYGSGDRGCALTLSGSDVAVGKKRRRMAWRYSRRRHDQRDVRVLGGPVWPWPPPVLGGRPPWSGP